MPSLYNKEYRKLADCIDQSYESIWTKQATTADFLTSQVEQEVIDYIRQEMQHNVSDSIPTEDELLAFFQPSDESTKLDAYQQMLSIGKLLEYAEISLRPFCDLIRYCTMSVQPPPALTLLQMHTECPYTV